MPSIIVSLAELGFTAHGCYRAGECELCHVESTTWFWRGKWLCENDVFETIVLAAPEVIGVHEDPVAFATSRTVGSHQ